MFHIYFFCNINFIVQESLLLYFQCLSLLLEQTFSKYSECITGFLNQFYLAITYHNSKSAYKHSIHREDKVNSATPHPFRQQFCALQSSFLACSVSRSLYQTHCNLLSTPSILSFSTEYGGGVITCTYLIS